MGCRLAQARAWAVRCQLELQAHQAACWVTLTYDDHHLPHTLHKRHLQLWLKRVRRKFSDRRVRFFACGEYGERFGRPHYHAILFGVSAREARSLGEHQGQVMAGLWGMGNVRVDELAPAAIAYVCGYQLKKAGFRDKVVLGCRVPDTYDGPRTEDILDRKTGELYRLRVDHQPAFVQMSRNPGIGGHARTHWRSWRTTAIWDNREVPVPRYLHQAWRGKATADELLCLQAEQLERQPATMGAVMERQRHLGASAVINKAKVKLTLSQRSL